MPSPLTSRLLLLLLVAAPDALAQTTLGELLDAGAARLSAEAFKRDVVQQMIVGTTPAGGTLEIMYAGNGSIAGSGTAHSGSSIRTPVDGAWTIDDQDRVCTSVGPAAGSHTPGVSSGVRLPRRCQYWFKLGESYYLADSDSDRHARVLRRTLATATATAALAPVTAATLPRAMKGNAYWSAAPATPSVMSGQVNAWSLAIAKANSDGTFDGVITFVAPGCAARELPIANGVIQGGELRFTVQMGARCPETFRLRRGSEHLLEGEAQRDVVGANPLRVWLDASP